MHPSAALRDWPSPPPAPPLTTTVEGERERISRPPQSLSEESSDAEELAREEERAERAERASDHRAGVLYSTSNVNRRREEAKAKLEQQGESKGCCNSSGNKSRSEPISREGGRKLHELTALLPPKSLKWIGSPPQGGRAQRSLGGPRDKNPAAAARFAFSRLGRPQIPSMHRPSMGNNSGNNWA